MKIATTKERILQYADYKGISKSCFYKDHELKRGLLDSDKLNQSISDIFIAKIIAKNTDLNPTWLLTGKGAMLLENDSVSSMAEAEPVAAYGKMPTVIEINPEAAKTNTLIADVHASAGFGSIVDNHQALEQLPSIHLPDAPYGLNVAFQINGDSMHPTIRHLDYVAANKINDIENIRDGHTCIIVDRDEGVLCKRIYRQGEAWKIVSDNPKYPPYNRDNGKIIAFFRAFCRWSYDFRNYHDDVRADISTLQRDVAEIKRDRKM